MSDGDLSVARPWRVALSRLGGAAALLWRGPLAWLRRVPIDDPVDRRNAPMLQLISLLLAVLPALAWLYRAVVVDIPWRPGEVLSMAMGLTVCAAAAASFGLIRYGRFAWASRLLLLAFAITIIPAYLSTGFGAQRFEQPVLVIWMAVAGLVVGRAALWLMFATVVVAFLAGANVDVAIQGEAAAIYADAVFSIAMFLMIAIVLDRSASALRHSLREANERGDQLALSNQHLRHEISKREQAQEQLVHSQKVEAVGRLAAGAAHDFGNLMAIITGYLRKGLRADSLDDVRHTLSGIDAAARRATLVTHKLLALAREDQEPEQAEVFDPVQVLLELQPLLRQLFNPDVHIDYRLPAVLPGVRMDRQRFELMVLNIAANADHAMAEGGVFMVQAESLPGEAEVALSFRDTGSGMGPEVLLRVFDPFFTTKPKGQGTGLGLSVVRDLVVKAGGEITASSSLGHGTRFSVHLPVVA
ncbi:sensor histidine kinase [Pseudoxanthomonas indica]|uniref:histidine kinase n=1 Tax=Pseudoxanthomonas indica TaxID=428993 RepID=A0A1T5KB61_9GAMM|nr:ATP-binding protein [Pseudoxanthomonas indica]GGD48133.1 hypothetical protein GCM10007235_19990 [Pseudoxanthomonas indica]SKC60943.1 Histidine kinase-, DNA gyrase B-, and HSP90-like ATPase [Pseudoxanthomonas indica]